MPKGFEAQKGGPAYVPSTVSSSVPLGRPTERLPETWTVQYNCDRLTTRRHCRATTAKPPSSVQLRSPPPFTPSHRPRCTRSRLPPVVACSGWSLHAVSYTHL